MTRRLLLSALLALASAAPALADDVTMHSTYPLRYGEQTNASAEDSLVVGSPTAGALTNVYGDVTVNGDLVVTKPSNCRLRMAAFMGPYTNDAFRIATDGNISVGLLPVANTPKIKVSTVLIGKDYYAWGDSADSPSVYGMMHGFQDSSITDSHLKRKAQFASRPAPGASTDVDPLSGTYGPLRMEAREVVFGVQYNMRSSDTSGGVLERVLIGTRTAWTAPVVSPQPEFFLQVGHPTEDSTTSAQIEDNGGAGSGWRIFSSRDYKTAIEPFTPAQCAGALDAIGKTDVVRYRFKNEPKTRPLHTGLIAEELPAEIRSPEGRSLNLSEAYAYAAAALKALKAENDELKARLSALEARKSGRAR